MAQAFGIWQIDPKTKKKVEGVSTRNKPAAKTKPSKPEKAEE